MTEPVTLAFLEPGHFHAALVLRRRNPRVSETVHLYARPGPERDGFVALVEAFNAREQDPTAWQLRVHETRGPLQALEDHGYADAVVLAGRNASKLATIASLHGANIPVLADKPWLTRPDAVAELEAVTAKPPLVMDIMTERHDVLARLRARIAASEALFGGFVMDEGEAPAIEIGSVHHLYKRVDGRPLTRPAWYYDVTVQGDGLVDIQSHMVDQAQWLTGEARPFDFAADVSRLSARRWGTAVDRTLFRDSTGLDDFPAELEARVESGVLDLQCNSELEYRLRGVAVRQRAEWGQREPDGGGDLHSAHLRGRRSELILRHGPQTGYAGQVHLRPRPGVALEPELLAAVAGWREEFPGLAVQGSELGFEIVVPASIRTRHESHFPMVLDEFLDRLGEPWPATLAARIRMRYTLLAAAKRAVDG